MKRRKFLKLLGLAPVMTMIIACKPKSKGTFEPYVPEEEPEREELARNLYKFVQYYYKRGIEMPNLKMEIAPGPSFFVRKG